MMFYQLMDNPQKTTMGKASAILYWSYSQYWLKFASSDSHQNRLPPLSLYKISGNISTRGKEQLVEANSEFGFLNLTMSEIGYYNCRNHKEIFQYSVNKLVDENIER